MVFNGLYHGAARLMCVGAIIEAAVVREAEYLFEEARYLFRLHIKGAETLNARRIDDVSAIRQQLHLAEGSGVHTRVVRVANFGRAKVYAWQNAVDGCRLAHAAVSAEQRNLIMQQRQQGIYAVALFGRDSHTLVAHGFVQRHHHVLIVSLFLRKQVGFIKHQYHGHAVSLGRSQEAVDESGRGLRIIDCNNEESLVYIGRNDMALLTQVLRLAYDIVASVFDSVDEGGALLVTNNLNAVATATGFVLRMPFNRKLPFILLSTMLPSSVFTVYQLPVFFITSPFI